MANCPKDLIDILTALATPTLAFFGIYIARRQWWTAEQKRKYELFDRRYQVYEGATVFLRKILQSPRKFDPENEKKFLDQFGPSKFLFNAEINQYLSELWTLYCNIQMYQSIMSDQAINNPEYNDAPKKHADLLKE